MNRFQAEFKNWEEWHDISCSVSVFSALIEYTFRKENLPIAEMESFPPATNAIFKVGDYVIKIFFLQDGIEMQSEKFSMERAEALGIFVPKLIACGVVEDKYRFYYMITEHISAEPFQDAVEHMTNQQKWEIGRQLRDITDKLNVPCDSFNNVDVILDEDRSERWGNYSEDFKQERFGYVRACDFGERVYVHGDMNGNNVLVTEDGKLCIIDFAEAVLAPEIYEHALIATELFQFDPWLLEGYFGKYSRTELAKQITDGLLIHDFGGDVVRRQVGQMENFHSIADLREQIRKKL